MTFESVTNRVLHQNHGAHPPHDNTCLRETPHVEPSNGNVVAEDAPALVDHSKAAQRKPAPQPAHGPANDIGNTQELTPGPEANWQPSPEVLWIGAGARLVARMAAAAPPPPPSRPPGS